MSGALACLQALAEGLHSRLHFYQDPAFYCPRQGNNASVPSKVRNLRKMRNFFGKIFQCLLFVMMIK